MGNTAVNQNALDQLKPIAYFDPYKGNNTPSKQSNAAKPGKTIAPKNIHVKTTMQKPELEVTHQRMASSMMKKFKTMSPDEAKETLAQLDITPENMHEVTDTVFKSLGEDQSAELVKHLLAENGITPKDIHEALQNPEFQSALGINPEDADVPETSALKTLINHMSQAFESNPYLMILSLSNKASSMNFQVQGSALQSMQTITNNMQETTKGLNQNVAQTKNEEQQNDSKHWWQKLLDIVVTIVAAVVVAVLVNVVANVVLPGLGFALDGLIAAGSALFDGAEVSAEVGGDIEMLDVVGNVTEDSSKVTEETIEETTEAGSKTESSDDSKKKGNTDSTEESEASRPQNATEELGQDEENKAKADKKNLEKRNKLDKAIDNLNDMIAESKKFVSDTVDKVTKPVKDYMSETKVGGKYLERDAAGRNYGKRMSNALLEKVPSKVTMMKIGAAIGALGGVALVTMVPASNENAKIAELQTEANIMNLGLQSQDLGYKSAQQIVQTQDQNNQTEQMTEAFALNIAKSMDTIPA